MRPVERGAAPRVYRKYEDAIGDLEDRLGCYCSYCERRLPVSLAVEHVVPKSLDPALRRAWDNFLLGCVNCNSVKGKKPTAGETFLWPDRDNTCRAFTYEAGGFVQVAEGLPQETAERARRLLDLVGLDRHKDRGWPRPTKRDRRWMQREAAWTLAVWAREKVSLRDDDDTRELVVEIALGYGFFSLWLAVFADHPPIKRELIRRFPGTSSACFDADGCPVERPGGRL